MITVIYLLGVAGAYAAATEADERTKGEKRLSWWARLLVALSWPVLLVYGGALAVLLAEVKS